MVSLSPALSQLCLATDRAAPDPSAQAAFPACPWPPCGPAWPVTGLHLTLLATTGPEPQPGLA